MPATDKITDELAAERAHLAAARAALRRMRDRAEALFRTGDQVAGDAYAAETLGTALARRVAELTDDPDTPLFFGKLRFSAGESDHLGTHHIGRRHVADEAGDPMVLDWRAPVSRAFYRASVADPHGVAVRRRFGFQRGELTSFEDERLTAGEELGTASRILTAEIERPRVGPMRDIVATIQPEQDELVRAELTDSVCVQGSPGTGKTAVGLHRAAYLLYRHPERLRRAGLLILGPNRAFLRYIESVLPALGEFDVAQATIEELLPQTAATGTDSAAAAALKHDPRLATVAYRAVWGSVRRPTAPIEVPDGSYRWRIGADALARVVDEVRAESLPYLAGRERVRARVTGLLQRQSEIRRGDSPGETWLRRMGRAKPVAGFLDATWPPLTPPQVLFRLWSDPAALAAAADGLLDPAEQTSLRWTKPPRSVRSAGWSEADRLLLDEIAGQLERPPGYAHVVIDEAQDLSPMQARALARRTEHGSVTVLGDLAQATAVWAAGDWGEILTHLGKPETPVTPLTVGFRVPAAVLTLANRILPALAVAVPPARSLRHDGQVDLRQVPDLLAGTVTAVRETLAYPGSIGVIAADAAVPALRSALVAAGLGAGDPSEPGAGRVTLVPATVVKGLEFDHVIVVEPGQIVAAETRGLHRLYVAFTRAVSRLTVVHAGALPAAVC